MTIILKLLGTSFNILTFCLKIINGNFIILNYIFNVQYSNIKTKFPVKLILKYIYW